MAKRSGRQQRDQGGRWRDGLHAWERLKHWLSDNARSVDDPPDNGQRAVDALADIGVVRRLLDQAELAAVRSARQHGKSWAEIATRLGVTRQSAWERWRDLDTEPVRATASPEPEAVPEIGSSAPPVLTARRARELRRRSSVTVPDVIGLRWEDAQRYLTGRGLVALGPDPDGPPLAVLASPRAVVTDQSPESGAKVPPGALVRLWVRRGDGSAGVREPRRPSPAPKSAREMRDEPADEAVG